MTTNNNNSNNNSQPFAYWHKEEVASDDLFVNEPRMMSEDGDRQPIRDGMVGTFRLRVWDDLFGQVGTFEKGKTFVKSLRTNDQVIGLLNALEIMAQDKQTGTLRMGVHSRYELSALQFVGDKIAEFAVIRFSHMSAADVELFASLGIKDDGKHQDRWVVLSAENGKLRFNRSVHPREPKDFISYMMTTFSEEAKKESGNEKRRVVKGYGDITKFDWNDNNRAWSQQFLHDGFDHLLAVKAGYRVVRLAPTFYEKSNKETGEIVGLSAKQQAQSLSERYIGMFGGSDQLIENRRQRKANGAARRAVKGMEFVLSNPDKYGMEVAPEILSAIEAGKVKVWRNGKVRITSCESLVSDLNGDRVWLSTSYANGEQPRSGKFCVFSEKELVGALQKAHNRDMFLKVLA